MTKRILTILTLAWMLTGCPGPDDGPAAQSTPTPPAKTGSGGLLYVQGVAGAETLVHRRDGEDRVLSDGPGRALCNEKIYCDLPPSGTLSRFLFYDFLSETHAVFLDVDHFDLPGNAVYSVNLDDGERTLLSGAVDFIDPGNGRPGWIYSADRSGAVTFWSLRTSLGMQLFRSSGAGDPLAPFAEYQVPADRRPIASWTAAAGGWVAWTVEVARDEPYGFEHYTWLLDLDGNELLSPADLPAGTVACDPPEVTGALVALSIWDGQTEGCDVLLKAGGAPVTLDLPQGSWMDAISPGGKYVIALNWDDWESTVYDVVTQTSVATFPGRVETFVPGADDQILVHDYVNGELVLHDIDARTSRVLIDGSVDQIGFSSFNQPGRLFTPDGGTLLTITGAPFLELWDNTGIRSVSLSDLEQTDIEVPSFSEEYYRHMRLSPDGRYVVYLAPAGSPAQLDIVAYDLLEGSRRPVVSSVEHERGFVVGDAFTPEGS